MLGLERGELSLDEMERSGLGDRGHEHVRRRGAVPDHVRLRHERAERPAHDDGVAEVERMQHRLDVVR
jgi:hypothetical protein